MDVDGEGKASRSFEFLSLNKKTDKLLNINSQAFQSARLHGRRKSYGPLISTLALLKNADEKAVTF